MRFLNNLIRVLVFILWAVIIFYLSKEIGITYDPEDKSAMRSYLRVINVVIIFGGAYFIWKINFIKKKNG